jgi:hypothetical protein
MRGSGVRFPSPAPNDGFRASHRVPKRPRNPPLARVFCCITSRVVLFASSQSRAYRRRCLELGALRRLGYAKEADRGRRLRDREAPQRTGSHGQCQLSLNLRNIAERVKPQAAAAQATRAANPRRPELAHAIISTRTALVSTPQRVIANARLRRTFFCALSPAKNYRVSSVARGFTIQSPCGVSNPHSAGRGGAA